MHRALAHCCRSVRASHQQQYLGGRLGFFFFTEAHLSQAPIALSSQSSEPWRVGAGPWQCLGGRADVLFFFFFEGHSSRALTATWAQSFRSGRGGADMAQRGEAERQVQEGRAKSCVLEYKRWRWSERGRRNKQGEKGEGKRQRNKKQATKGEEEGERGGKNRGARKSPAQSDRTTHRLFPQMRMAADTRSCSTASRKCSIQTIEPRPSASKPRPVAIQLAKRVQPERAQRAGPSPSPKGAEVDECEESGGRGEGSEGRGTSQYLHTSSATS